MEKPSWLLLKAVRLHRVYKKVITSTKKVMAHDESNAIEAGSVVQVVESKPISKNKRWVVEKVLEGPGGRVLEPIVGEIVVDEEEEAEVPAEVPEVAESSVEVEAPAEVRSYQWNRLKLKRPPKCQKPLSRQLNRMKPKNLLTMRKPMRRSSHDSERITAE